MVDECLFIELIIHNTSNWFHACYGLLESLWELEALGLSLHPEDAQPTCDYSKSNFTVLSVSYNFTTRHEIKIGCALGLT